MPVAIRMLLGAGIVLCCAALAGCGSAPSPRETPVPRKPAPIVSVPVQEMPTQETYNGYTFIGPVRTADDGGKVIEFRDAYGEYLDVNGRPGREEARGQVWVGPRSEVPDAQGHRGPRVVRVTLRVVISGGPVLDLVANCLVSDDKQQFEITNAQGTIVHGNNKGTINRAVKRDDALELLVAPIVAGALGRETGIPPDRLSEMLMFYFPNGTADFIAVPNRLRKPALRAATTPSH